MYVLTVNSICHLLTSLTSRIQNSQALGVCHRHLLLSDHGKCPCSRAHPMNRPGGAVVLIVSPAAYAVQGPYISALGSLLLSRYGNARPSCSQPPVSPRAGTGTPLRPTSGGGVRPFTLQLSSKCEGTSVSERRRDCTSVKASRPRVACCRGMRTAR